jgi:DNA processing protein
MSDQSHSAADAGGVVGPDVVAACALSAVPGIGSSALLRLASVFGTLRDALAAGPARILQQAAALKLTQPARDFLVRDPDLEALGLWAVAAARSAGARIVLLGDPWYPELLRQIDRAPALLYVRGTLEPASPRVAVVGSRDADDYGLEIAKQLGEGLALAGVQVVSGGARGIDAAAHAGALWGGGTTVAVLGCGIDVVYPPEHGELYERLARGGGAVISELPPGTPAGPRNFPRRNRIISGLSSAVVIVRAALGSGALNTGDHAAGQGRPLFAVPGDATLKLSAGPNELLRLQAAKAATSARDVLVELGWAVPAQPASASRAEPRLFPENTDPRAARPRPATNTSDRVLDEASVRLWQLLDPRLPLHADELATRARLSPQETLRRLAELELKGLCTQRPGKYFLRREP